MKKYSRTSLVTPGHIQDIAQQLEKRFGSGVEGKYLNGEPHRLANVLNLALSFHGLSANQINSICSNVYDSGEDYTINY